MSDPVEKIIADALASRGIRFCGGGDSRGAGLDFYLLDHDIHIEAKRFYSHRIAEQMSRAADVIAIQGIEAAELFASLMSAPPPVTDTSKD